MRRSSLLLLALVLASAPLLTPGCATNSLTGKRSFMLIGQADEIQLGQQAAPGMATEMGGSYADPVIKKYVQTVGAKVAAEAVKAGSYEYPFTFDVLDSDVVNAFALPGGPIFITRALLFQMNDESELAGVLAHEVTHVAAQHSAQQISKQVGAEVVLSVLKTAAGGSSEAGSSSAAEDLAKVVGGLITLKYTRDNETESDAYGIQFMTQAGYQPAGLIRVMEMFQQQEEAAGGGGPEFLRTHPFPENRIESIREVIDKKFPGALTNTRLVTGAAAYKKNVLSRQGLVKQYSTSK